MIIYINQNIYIGIYYGNLLLIKKGKNINNKNRNDIYFDNK